MGNYNFTKYVIITSEFEFTNVACSWEPTPVNAYPAGVTSTGVWDMIGNGWEWTSDLFMPFPGIFPHTIRSTSYCQKSRPTNPPFVFVLQFFILV